MRNIHPSSPTNRHCLFVCLSAPPSLAGWLDAWMDGWMGVGRFQSMGSSRGSSSTAGAICRGS